MKKLFALLLGVLGTLVAISIESKWWIILGGLMILVGGWVLGTFKSPKHQNEKETTDTNLYATFLFFSGSLFSLVLYLNNRHNNIRDYILFITLFMFFAGIDFFRRYKKL